MITSCVALRVTSRLFILATFKAQIFFEWRLCTHVCKLLGVVQIHELFCFKENKKHWVQSYFI